jgi:prepilin-type N-terminal cleavage/methylation domain-containing protein
MWAKKKQPGFTIVELLIVIVVIAILAAITIVAYNGIQDRANDTSVRADLASIMKSFKLYSVDAGRYPMTDAELQTVLIKVSKNAYRTGAGVSYNLIPCVTSGGADVSIAAVSKSGSQYYISSQTGSVKQYVGANNWNGATGYSTGCTDALSGSSLMSGGGGCGSPLYCVSWKAWVNS